MMNLIRSIFQKQSATLKDKATPGLISNAFTKRAKEIESLRKYDRGEKEITAPDIRSIVRSL